MILALFKMLKKLLKVFFLQNDGVNTAFVMRNVNILDYPCAQVSIFIMHSMFFPYAVDTELYFEYEMLIQSKLVAECFKYLNFHA